MGDLEPALIVRRAVKQKQTAPATLIPLECVSIRRHESDGVREAQPQIQESGLLNA
jgi:hypothetical protein